MAPYVLVVAFVVAVWSFGMALRSTRRIMRYDRGIALIDKSRQGTITAEENRELDVLLGVEEFSYGVKRWAELRSVSRK